MVILAKSLAAGMSLAAYCLENGLLILVCGSYSNIVRVLTPFVITDEQLDKGLAIMEAGLAAISSEANPAD